MKPHPRIRKTIKWGGTVVTVVFALLWVGSARAYAQYISAGGGGVAVARGLVIIVTGGWHYLHSGFHFNNAGVEWWFSLDGQNGMYRLQIPLWFPIVASSGATLVAWRLDARARRRARLNLCPKCDYDRAGIAGDARCPECGAAPICRPTVREGSV